MTVQMATAAQETTTVIGALDWAYRRQKAHVTDESEGFGLRIGSPRDSLDKLEAMKGLLGCKIDGGQWKEIGHRVHPDAAAIVDAVGRLPDFCRHLVSMHAAAGTMPDWGEVCRYWPRLQPANGKPTVIEYEVTVTSRRGRPTRVLVKYCPCSIFPDPEYCREEWRMWFGGLELLRAEMAGLRLWRVVGIGVEREPWEKSA